MTKAVLYLLSGTSTSFGTKEVACLNHVAPTVSVVATHRKNKKCWQHQPPSAVVPTRIWVFSEGGNIPSWSTQCFNPNGLIFRHEEPSRCQNRDCDSVATEQPVLPAKHLTQCPGVADRLFHEIHMKYVLSKQYGLRPQKILLSRNKLVWHIYFRQHLCP